MYLEKSDFDVLIHIASKGLGVAVRGTFNHYCCFWLILENSPRKSDVASAHCKAIMSEINPETVPFCFLSNSSYETARKGKFE